MSSPTDGPTHARPDVTAALLAHLAQARWFGGKGRPVRDAVARRAAALSPGVVIELVTVTYDGPGVPDEVYQVPLALYDEPQERLAHALVGHWTEPDGRAVVAYDALHDREATAVWQRLFDQAATVDGLTFHRLPGHRLDLETHSTLFSGEQSNSSVAFGEDSLMKVFRKVTPGVNPDIEIHEALSRAASTHVASLYGWLELSETGSPPLQLAMLQQFLRTASDGWDLALGSVRILLAEGDLHAEEVGGDFAAEARRLGVAVAEVHEVLASAFPTRPAAPADVASLVEGMEARLAEALTLDPALASYADGLRAVYAALPRLDAPITLQRIHGDLHLGQTLRTTRGWKLVDFEGEPAKTLAERRAPDSRWRDVAGMLRSFDYAAQVAARDEGDGAGPRRQVRYRAQEWTARNRAAFLEGYRAGSADDPASPALLAAYEADKAVYEVMYEARNRPSWVDIPSRALARLAAGPIEKEKPE